MNEEYSTLHNSAILPAPQPQPHPAYQALAPHSNSTRIVVLEPALASSQETISCTITNVVLSHPSCPPYEALSYMWGSTANPCSIIINGYPFAVTSNLHAALQYLRLPDRPRTFWVDAICIDQTNASERNHQVRLMGRIYSQAMTVVAWLGLSTDFTRLAFEFLRDWPSLIKIWVFRIWFERGLSDDCWTPDIEALADLCNSPYWNRVWIVQEVFLAKQLLLQCGEDVVDYEELVKVAWPWCDVSWPKTSDGKSSHPAVKALRGSRGIKLLDKKANKHIGLMQLMDGFKESQCALAHDRVYAYLGIASDYKEDFDIDYEKSLEEVYCDLIRFFYRNLEHNEQRLADIGEKYKNAVKASEKATYYARTFDTFSREPFAGIPDPEKVAMIRAQKITCDEEEIRLSRQVESLRVETNVARFSYVLQQVFAKATEHERQRLTSSLVSQASFSTKTLRKALLSVCIAGHLDNVGDTVASVLSNKSYYWHHRLLLSWLERLQPADLALVEASTEQPIFLEPPSLMVCPYTDAAKRQKWAVPANILRLEDGKTRKPIASQEDGLEQYFQEEFSSKYKVEWLNDRADQMNKGVVPGNAQKRTFDMFKSIEKAGGKKERGALNPAPRLFRCGQKILVAGGAARKMDLFVSIPDCPVAGMLWRFSESKKQWHVVGRAWLCDGMIGAGEKFEDTNLNVKVSVSLSTLKLLTSTGRAGMPW